jgi:hypothetical protein
MDSLVIQFPETLDRPMMKPANRPQLSTLCRRDHLKTNGLNRD